MYLGLFGTYRKHETVDVEYTLGGETKLAADLEILPDSTAKRIWPRSSRQRDLRQPRPRDVRLRARPGPRAR